MDFVGLFLCFIPFKDRLIAHKKKNWVLIDSVKGAQASAIIYSISETAKLNGLNPYYYLEHLLAEIPKLIDENGNIKTSKLDQLLLYIPTTESTLHAHFEQLCRSESACLPVC